MSSSPSPRVLALQQTFAEIARTRMLGVPVQNHAIQVQAIGFAPEPDNTNMLLGVLVTPWFMNLVRLPTQTAFPGERLLSVGKKANRSVGNRSFEFMGADEPDIGAFEVCSLFSPMFEFANHATAADTANEILKLLRMPVKPAPTTPPNLPSRRGFLLGRGIKPERAPA
jgi:[NiFe] hydrogenase assembly HybE family chaperone